MKRWFVLGLLCWFFASSLGCELAEANNRSYWRGRYRYRKRRCRSATYYLKRAIKARKRRLKRKYLIRAYKMMASCDYRRRRWKSARKRYRAALRISVRAGLPGRTSRRGRRFFRRVRRKFKKEQKKSGPAFGFQMKKKGPGPDILPDNPKSRTVPPPLAVPKVPGVKLPDDGPAGRSIKLANRAVVVRAPPPDDGGGLFRRSGKKTSLPYQAQSPSKVSPILRRHRWSLIVGSIGLVTLGVGIGVGAAFSGQKESLQQLLLQRSTSVAQLEEAHINAGQLVVPANIFLVTGGVISASAIGILIGELVASKSKKGAKNAKGGR